MTIQRGQEWGSVGPAPAGLVTVGSDRELRRLVEAARRAGSELPPVGLLGGDLLRALGGTGRADRFAGDVARLPVDVVRVEAEDPAAPGEVRTAWFVAHAIARRSWWRGEVVAAMNAQHLGAWDVAPRGHPNDGRVDLVAVDRRLPVRARLQARSRLPQGTHVPHPDISVRQSADVTIELRRPLDVALDGEPWGRATRLRFVVEPDALLVCV